MSLIFYFAPMSTATLTNTVLEELGVPHDKKRVELRGNDSSKADLLKVNPNGKVPVIVHEGVAIWESSAITMYLGEQFGVAKGLYPAAGPKRGEAMKWIAWTNVTLGEAMYRRGHSGEWAEPDHGNPKAVEKADKDIQELLGILDAALAGKQFLLGGDYSLADTHLNSYCDWFRHSKIDFSSFANINAWTQRCTQRPAYQRAMAFEMGK